VNGTKEEEDVQTKSSKTVTEEVEPTETTEGTVVTE
jgi:hypothetical protein